MTTQNIKLKRIIKGLYYDDISGRMLEEENGIWYVKNQCHGEVYYQAKSLNECKRWQSLENDILSWND